MEIMVCAGMTVLGWGGQANAAMQVELLTGQLERARRENLMLQGQLRAACQGLPLPEVRTPGMPSSWPVYICYCTYKLIIIIIYRK